LVGSEDLTAACSRRIVELGRKSFLRCVKDVIFSCKYTAYKHKLRFPQVDSEKGSLNLYI
jgi:hypothetical protein